MYIVLLGTVKAYKNTLENKQYIHKLVNYTINVAQSKLTKNKKDNKNNDDDHKFIFSNYHFPKLTTLTNYGVIRTVDDNLKVFSEDNSYQCPVDKN